MANDIPIIPKVGHMLVNTGNIVNWSRLKKKLTQVPTEELSECISSTIATWLQTANRTELQYVTSIDCVDEKYSSKLPQNERQELKITVKLFLSSPSAEDVHDSVKNVCAALDVTQLETVLISLRKQTSENLKTVWQALEDLVEQEIIFSLGVADLDKAQLEELYDWAKVKPCIDQVNLESCCIMPQDLTEYAKEKDIQLLTHNDPKEILPEQKLQEVLAGTLTIRDAENWEPSWVARYSVLFICRGIIKAKGYIAKCQRDIKKRK